VISINKAAEISNKTVVIGFQLVGLYSVYMLISQDSTWYGRGIVMIVALNAFTLAKVYSIGEKVDI
jgi:hypothetical protein